jgi:1,4-dihydroxy-2-naphthoate octaprenyltransferase
MTMNSPKQLLGPMRVPFLVLPPACVLLGAGTALWTRGQISILNLILVFVGAMAAHISVNALNEYSDFRSGLDLQTKPTPFSGGSGTLPTAPQLAVSARNTGVIALAITGLIGVYFAILWGWAILPLGILGLVVIVTYTDWITHLPLLCLIAPGLGFGTLMVMGTDFSLTGTYSWTAFIASLVPFFLVSNLLLLNQFPDAEPDRTVGRRHFPIVVGRKKSSLIYSAFLLLTYLSIGIGVGLGYLPALSLLGLITLVAAIPTGISAFRYADQMDKLIPFMGLNVLITVFTPILVGIGLLIAA